MTPIEFVDYVASFTLYDEDIGTPDYEFLLNDSADLQKLVRLAKEIQEQIV